MAGDLVWSHFRTGVDYRNLVLDLTVQGVHITNQTVIYRIHPDARNRLTAGYMTSYFIGGAAGSLISASAWQHGGWAGVCLAGATIAPLTYWSGGEVFIVRKPQIKQSATVFVALHL